MAPQSLSKSVVLALTVFIVLNCYICKVISDDDDSDEEDDESENHNSGSPQQQQQSQNGNFLQIWEACAKARRWNELYCDDYLQYCCSNQTLLDISNPICGYRPGGVYEYIFLNKCQFAYFRCSLYPDVCLLTRPYAECDPWQGKSNLIFCHYIPS